jgi:uncharacterized membrane protein YcjF (UPF0283 family)
MEDMVMTEAQMVIREVMQNEVCVFVALGVSILLVGFWLGYVIREWSWIPRKKQRAYFNDAPVPVMPARDCRRGEKVVICGYEWTRM